MTRRRTHPLPRRFYRPWLNAQPYERWPGDWLPEDEMQRADEPGLVEQESA